jgi:hypothetical protein
MRIPKPIKHIGLTALILSISIILYKRHEQQEILKLQKFYADELARMFDGHGNYLKHYDGYDMVMIDKQQNRIKKNARFLKEGMKRDEVLKLFGRPTYSERQGTKEGKFIGISCMYYFYKVDINSVNERDDKSLELFFDTNDKLHAIGTNIKGLRQKGWCEPFLIRSLYDS